MPDLPEQVREATRCPTCIRLYADGCRNCNWNGYVLTAAAVALAAEAAAEVVCSQCCGDSESRASVRRQVLDAFLAKLSEAPDA